MVYNKFERHIGTILVERGWWIEHLFVVPEHIKTGLGTALIQHAVTICNSRGSAEIKIFADPYSAGFYERIGAYKLRDADSTIPGRTIPVYKLVINPVNKK